MSKRYLVIKQQKVGFGDIFVDVFESLEDANRAAENKWYHLTDYEQKKECVVVAEVTEADLDDFAFEDGEIDWTAYTQYNIPENGFDSNDLKDDEEDDEDDEDDEEDDEDDE